MSRVETIGDAKLHLGDCRDVLARLPGGRVDLIWTDPPYGHNNAEGDLLSALNAGALGRKPTAAGTTPIANDGPAEMRAVVDAMLREAARLLRPSAACCVCCAGGGAGSAGPPSFVWLAERMSRLGLEFCHATIWDKVNPGLGWRYKRQYEMVMIAHPAGGRLAWAERAQPIGNVFRGFLPGAQRQHPNEKPLWLVKGFIERHTEPGGLVVDPFMGGGTTGVAALQLGRRFIGVELDPEHFATARRRIAAAEREPELALAPRPEQIRFEL